MIRLTLARTYFRPAFPGGLRPSGSGELLVDGRAAEFRPAGLRRPVSFAASVASGMYQGGAATARVVAGAVEMSPSSTTDIFWEDEAMTVPR